MFISHVEILGVETCSQILETGEDDMVQTGTFLYLFIVLVLEVRGFHFLAHSQLVDYLTKPLSIKSKPSKRNAYYYTIRVVNQIFWTEHVSQVPDIFYGLFVFKNLSSQSLEVFSMKHEWIFPPIWSPPPPFLLLLQHKPSQENNKQMSRMGTAPSKSSQALRQASFSVLVPRVEGKGHASAWQSQWLSRTRKTWQKLPLSVSFIHSFQFYTPTCTSLYTQSKEPRVKQ